MTEILKEKVNAFVRIVKVFNTETLASICVVLIFTVLGLFLQNRGLQKDLVLSEKEKAKQNAEQYERMIVMVQHEVGHEVGQQMDTVKKSQAELRSKVDTSLRVIRETATNINSKLRKK